MQLTINGDRKELAPARLDLQALIESMQLKGDRIAVELNGEIVARTKWAETAIKEHDRLEIVHFVGGGCGFRTSRGASETERTGSYRVQNDACVGTVSKVLFF